MTDPAQIFDRVLLRRRRDRAADTQAHVAPILEDLADRLLDRLDDTTRRFTRALDIGGRGLVAPRLAARGIPFVVSADLGPRMAARAGGLPVAADEEWLPFAPGAFDLIVSSVPLAITPDTVVIGSPHTERRRELAADTVVHVSVPRPERDLADALIDMGIPVVVIGDAAGGHGIQKAIREATEAGRSL